MLSPEHPFSGEFSASLDSENRLHLAGSLVLPSNRYDVGKNCTGRKRKKMLKPLADDRVCNT